MQDKRLFEYSVVRVVPRVEREEFLNVGVIVYCADENFLRIKFSLDPHRLAALTTDLNIPDMNKMLSAFEQICMGSTEGGPISKLSIASRFRWLTATRSTIVQTSPVHPGLCYNAEDTLNKLFDEMVK